MLFLWFFPILTGHSWLPREASLASYPSGTRALLSHGATLTSYICWGSVSKRVWLLPQSSDSRRRKKYEEGEVTTDTRRVGECREAWPATNSRFAVTLLRLKSLLIGPYVITKGSQDKKWSTTFQSFLMHHLLLLNRYSIFCPRIKNRI